ncbi:MAG: hypothetical protein WC261_13160, partial [Synergistaceae bacterium]
AFRHFKSKSGKSTLEIAGSYQAARTLVRILKGEINKVSPRLLRRFADNMGSEINDLIPDEKSDNIIREFVEVE